MPRLKQYFQKGLIEVGCDEAGRGCLAGPVVAAAVILGPKNVIRGINDSKQLSGAQRDKMAEKIKHKAIAYGIGVVDHREIDEINILNASFLAMHRAIDQLKIRPALILVDGNRFNTYDGIDHQCIIKGDAKFRSIAAASILAKTYRDKLMRKYSSTFPQYGWSQNMGYPTKKHRLAIAEYGPSDIHRMTFRLLAEEQHT